MINLAPDKCTECQECVSVCPNYVFAQAERPEGGRAVQVRYPDQCCACGHCLAVCPTGAISHPDLPLDQFLPLPRLTVTPDEVQALLRSRRSIRNYHPDSIPDTAVQSLLTAAVHAGTSSNGQTEGFILVRDQLFLRQLEQLVVDVLWKAGLKYIAKEGLMCRLLRWKYGAEMLRQYRPYHGIFRHRREEGLIAGAVFRNAPLVIIGHGLRANALAATNCALAMRNIELLALPLGLGTCWVGFLVAAAGKSKHISRALGLARDRQVYGALMVGYPKEQYSCEIPRKSRSVTWI